MQGAMQFFNVLKSTLMYCQLRELSWHVQLRTVPLTVHWPKYSEHVEKKLPLCGSPSAYTLHRGRKQECPDEVLKGMGDEVSMPYIPLLRNQGLAIVSNALVKVQASPHIAGTALIVAGSLKVKGALGIPLPVQADL